MSQPWTHTPGAKAYARLNEHYVEPHWVSERLFADEPFVGHIHDPSCGFGRIVESAKLAGYTADGLDLVDRGYYHKETDFLLTSRKHDNIVCNPPFDIFEEFARHALALARRKVAMIMPTARLNAARWLEDTPLLRVWLLTPRPSMPPGHVITAGGKVGGGKSDYCWLVWTNIQTSVNPEIRWLHRDPKQEQENENEDFNRRSL